MRIGLFGFTFGHENMGCQALTCAFLDMLQMVLPNENIEIVSFHRENNLGEIPKLFPKMEFKLCKIKIKDPKLTFIKEIKKCDVIFDETYGDGFSDIYFGKAVYISVGVKYLCAISKTKYILTPQTYGPFKRKILEKLSGQVIRRANRVFARDGISGDYAEKISGRKVEIVTDLAFALPYKKMSSTGKKKLGLNVSGLLWNGGFGDQENQFGLVADYKEYCRELVKYALDNGFEVHIIPHVTQSTEPSKICMDGDFPVCQNIAAEFSGAILAPCFQNPFDAKNYIAQMDFFIGARMHSTIAAFSSGVVTIPFAYSRKFQGLYENIGYPYYIDGTSELTKDCIDKTIRWIEEPSNMILSQKRSLTLIEIKLNCFRDELKNVLDKVKFDK